MPVLQEPFEYWRISFKVSLKSEVSLGQGLITPNKTAQSLGHGHALTKLDFSDSECLGTAKEGREMEKHSLSI